MPAPLFLGFTPLVELKRSFESDDAQPLTVFTAQYVHLDSVGKRVAIALSDTDLERFFAGIEDMKHQWEARKAEQ